MLSKRARQRVFGPALPMLCCLLVSCGGSSNDAGSPLTSQTFYVDSMAGNDANNGTSAATPWQTLAHVSQATFILPTTLYLKRGDSWHEGLTVPASNITIDAYGSGAAPLLDGSQAVDAWAAAGGGIYSASVTLTSAQALGNLSENGRLMAFLPWQGSTGSTFAGAVSGTYSYDYAATTLYIAPTGNPTANRYLASVIPIGLEANGVSNVSVRDIAIQRMSLHGIQFQDCNHCSAVSVALTGIGGAVVGSTPGTPQYLYAGNGIEIANDSIGDTIENASVSDVFDSCISVQTFRSNATAANIAISGNTVARCGFAGVELSVLSNGGTSGSHINAVSVDGLGIDRAGTGWSGRRYGSEGEGLRIEADSGAGTMSGIAVTNTVASGSAGDGLRLAGELGTVQLSRVRLTGNTGYGIEVTDSSAKSLFLQLASSIVDDNASYGLIFDAPIAAGLRVNQDTFYDNAGIDLAIQAQSGTADIRNNLFYSDKAVTDLYAAASLVGVTLDHNCYNDSSNMIGYAGVAYSDVASFYAATGLEAHGNGAGPVDLDDPASGNFQIAAASSCRGLGDPTVNVMTDYAGLPFADPPASGAYEFH